MTPEVAARIYALLVEHAKADARELESFVDAHVHMNCQEWRFMGSLGFGGKFYSRHGWRVGCYREDETPARLNVIAATNAALDTLRKEARGA